MSQTKLHHIAKRIKAGELETAIELFSLLGMKVTYQPQEFRWAMIAQDGVNIDIQLAEVEDSPMQGTKRIGSHIGFLSSDPNADIERITEWASEKGLPFERGKWDDTQLWFDFPDLFIDWVVEIMNKSVVEEAQTKDVS